MPVTSVASHPTSLKLPAALKAQLEFDAQNAGLSLHAFMLQTLADSARRTRLREAFTLDAMTALHDMKSNGSGGTHPPSTRIRVLGGGALTLPSSSGVSGN